MNRKLSLEKKDWQNFDDDSTCLKHDVYVCDNHYHTSKLTSAFF